MSRLLHALLLLAATASAADARQSTLNLSCNQAATVVASAGAIVLSTGRHTYERFVSRPGYCEIGMWADRAWAPTRDTRSCQLGYVCRHRPAPWEEGLFSDDW